MAGLGSRIDIRLAMIRIGFFHEDHKVIADNIDAAQVCVAPSLFRLVPASLSDSLYFLDSTLIPDPFLLPYYSRYHPDWSMKEVTGIDVID